MEPVVPTLGVTTFLTDPTKIMAYVLRQYVTAPKTATYVWTDEIISLTETLSRFEDIQENVREPISRDLTSALNRIFDNDQTQVQVETERREDNISYNVVINMTVFKNGQPFTLSDNVIIRDGLPVVNDQSPR